MASKASWKWRRPHPFITSVGVPDLCFVCSSVSAKVSGHFSIYFNWNVLTSFNLRVWTARTGHHGLKYHQENLTVDISGRDSWAIGCLESMWLLHHGRSVRIGQTNASQKYSRYEQFQHWEYTKDFHPYSSVIFLAPKAHFMTCQMEGWSKHTLLVNPQADGSLGGVTCTKRLCRPDSYLCYSPTS